jgi:hypothetical protein
VAGDSRPDRLEPEGVPQHRLLASDEREVLHRVIGMLQDDPGYASAIGPGLRAAIAMGPGRRSAS